jgi:hypothetical protein
MALPEIVIGSKLDAKGFKQAETATEKLGRSVKNLAKTLGLAFSTVAIVNYGKSAVKAALDAQAQQQRLAALLKVTNGATQDQVNVLNDQAAALEKIGVVTGGSITQVQSQLATFDLQLSTIQALTPAILDYVVAEKGAAASASEFKSMTNGLAQALNGNFASLTKTGFVLDATTKDLIANGTEAERAAALVEVLNSTYKDFNKNLRDTPMGQFQVLANSAEQAKTIIGTDLLAAMKLVAGKDGIGGATTAMEGLATEIGNVIYGIGVLASKVKSIPGFTFIKDVFSVMPGLQTLANFGQNNKPRTGAQSPGERKAIDKINRDALRFQKQQNDLAKIDIANTTRKLVLTADQQALEELKKKFDIERISINAALNANIDKETELRLKSLLAIHDNDAALAGKIKAEIEATKAITDFATTAARAAALLLQVSYSSGLSSFRQSEINSLTQGPAAPSIPDVLTQPMPTVPMSPLQSFRESEARYAGSGAVSIQINPAVAGLIDVIQNQSASGISPTVNRVSSSYIA